MAISSLPARGVNGLAANFGSALASDYDPHNSCASVFGILAEQFYTDLESYRRTL